MKVRPMVNGKLVTVRTLGATVDKKVEKYWVQLDQCNWWLECLEANTEGRMLSPTAHAYLSLMDSAVTKFKKRIRSIQERDAELWESELKRLGVIEDSTPANPAQ